MASKFGLSAMKRYPEVAPLCAIMGVALAGVGSYMIYALFYKTDVTLVKTKGSRWANIDVNKPQKLLTLNQTYGEDPSVTALKAELYDAYEKK